jgi:hypothetical protein
MSKKCWKCKLHLLGFLIALLALFFIQAVAFAKTESPIPVTKLYATRLVSLDVPKAIQEQIGEKFGVSIVDTDIYVASLSGDHPNLS